jgi:hypothetical protein
MKNKAETNNASQNSVKGHTELLEIVKPVEQTSVANNAV